MSLFEDNDRVDRAPEQLSLLIGNEDKVIDLVRPDHDRKRLLDPAEPLFELVCRLFGACEMEPANPAHGKDESRIEQRCRFFYTIAAVDPAPEVVVESELRSAVRAGDRLGMVAPGLRVAVLAGTGRADREVCHRGPFPVIGNSGNDAVPGTAVHARGRPVVFVPPAFMIKVGNALAADRNIGRDHAGMGTGPAGQDEKTVRDLPYRAGHFHGIDPGERGTP